MGKLDGSEQVLCVPTDAVRRIEGLGGFSGEWIAATSLEDEFEFLPRTEELERDTSWLQVIPYGTIWRTLDGLPHCLVYRRGRAGTEGRLHDLLSLGIGGHVNPCDAEKPSMVLNAMRRELREETGLEDADVEFQFQGLIWSPEWTGVESVHIGAYYEILVSGRDWSLGFTEDAIDVVGWASHRDLESMDRDQFETWSRAVLDGLIFKERAS